MLGEHAQLSVPRSSGTLELYSDASHAPAGGRSMQCTLAVWRASAIAWEATRQPFTALSSTEAELISMVHSLQVGDSVIPVIEELTQQDVHTALMADNDSALSSFAPSSGSWRNRHLRMRAFAASERVEAGVLTASYVPAELQAADVGAKPLGGAKLLGLLSLVNVRLEEKEDEAVLAAKALGRARTGVMPPLNPSVSAVAAAAIVLASLPGVEAQPVGGSYGDWAVFRWLGQLVVALAVCVIWKWKEGERRTEVKRKPPSRRIRRKENPVSEVEGPEALLHEDPAGTDVESLDSQVPLETPREVEGPEAPLHEDPAGTDVESLDSQVLLETPREVEGFEAPLHEDPAGTDVESLDSQVSQETPREVERQEAPLHEDPLRNQEGNDESRAQVAEWHRHRGFARTIWKARR